MKKILLVTGLIFTTQASASQKDILKKFEVKENAVCKSLRLYDEGGYSGSRRAVSYDSYRINDIKFSLATRIVANSLKSNGATSGLQRESEDFYYEYVVETEKSYYYDYDKIGKYVTDVCITTRLNK